MNKEKQTLLEIMINQTGEHEKMHVFTIEKKDYRWLEMEILFKLSTIVSKMTLKELVNI